MKAKIQFFLGPVAAVSLLALSPFALAAGGGGGGSVPTCSESVWNCGSWGDCSASGIQTRTCTLTFYCPSDTTPAPAQQQSCTPMSTPTPSVISPTRSPEPTVNPSACNQDTWSCSDWSKTCDVQGNQSRTCTKTFDCPAASNPSPATTERCDHLQCGNLPTLSDRITCRVNLAPAGVARELELQYLPEECRAMPKKSDQENCEARYKSFKPCWNLPDGQGRFDCAAQALNLGTNLSAAIAVCKSKTGQEQAICIAGVREQVFDMIKFRFYDLEQRAEELWAKGVTPATIAQLEIAIETQKQAFDQATSDEQRKQIILQVRQAWQDFVNQAKGEITQ